MARLCLIALCLLLAAPSYADAAVRRCTEFIASAGEDAASEITAKQKAMAGWTAAASKFGPAFVLWRNAADKSLSCIKLASGPWRCQAYGRACGISQVPGAMPPNTLPPQPQDPRKSNRIQI